MRTLSGSDSWAFFGDRANPVVVQAAVGLEKLSLEDVRAVLRRVLITEGRFPELKQRVEGLRATERSYYDPPTWPPRMVPDEKFSVERHVTALAEEPACVRTEQDLTRILSDLTTNRPLPTDRPLWEVLFIENYNGDDASAKPASNPKSAGAADSPASAGAPNGSPAPSKRSISEKSLRNADLEKEKNADASSSGSALILRIHHSIADGLALGMFLKGLVDEVSRGDALPSVYSKVGVKRAPGLAQKALLYARLMLFPLTLLARVFVLGADKNRLKKPLTGAKAVALSREIDLASLKTIKTALNVTVNDILVACCSGALRELMSNGTAAPNCKAAIPISVRWQLDREVLNNKVGVAHVPLHTDQADPMKRLLLTQRTFNGLKTSPEGIGIYWSSVMVSMLGRWIYQPIASIFACKSTCILSNVPGPDKEIFIAGRRVKSIAFWVCAAGSMGVYLAFISYNGKVNVGTMVDTGVMESAQPLADGIVHQFREYERLAAAAPPALAAEAQPPTSSSLAATTAKDLK